MFCRQNLNLQQRYIVTQTSMYTLDDDILYFSGQKGGSPRAVILCGLLQSMMEEYHSEIMVGQFSGPKIYKTALHQW